MKQLYLCVAVASAIGFVAGRTTVKRPEYYLTKEIHFEQLKCQERTEMVDGAIRSKSWSVIDSSDRLFFSSFHDPNELGGCEEFYVMFGKKP